MAQVRQIKRNALCAEVNQSFAIAHSHYGNNINLEVMSHDYAPSYEVHELEEMKMAVAPCRGPNTRVPQKVEPMTIEREKLLDA